MFGKTGWTFRGFPKAPRRSERKKWDARYLRDTQEERFDIPRKLRDNLEEKKKCRIFAQTF